jgi:hypothetical protein
VPASALPAATSVQVTPIPPADITPVPGSATPPAPTSPAAQTRP